MSNFAEISICPPPNYSKTMMTCSKIKSLPPKGVYYSLFQSIDAATLTTDWEAKPDQSVLILTVKTVVNDSLPLSVFGSVQRF